MGADWVRLFDKQLCDEIVELKNSTLAGFVSSRLPELDQYNEFRFGFEEDVPIPDRIRHLLESGLVEWELKHILVNSLCAFGGRLTVDYCGLLRGSL